MFPSRSLGALALVGQLRRAPAPLLCHHVLGKAQGFGPLWSDPGLQRARPLVCRRRQVQGIGPFPRGILSDDSTTAAAGVLSNQGKIRSQAQFN
jgi:hypothetical protein